MNFVFFQKVVPVTCRWRSTQANVYEETLFNVPETKVTTLSNGMRVATEDSGSPTCTVGLCIDAGSRWENKQNNGTAHFLEHMTFKGTDRRSESDIDLEVENLGAQLNANTSREQTFYFAKCFSQDMPKAVDLISDIVQNSKITEENVEKERGVICREMQEVNYDMREVVMDYLHTVAYEGTPLGFTILGPSENVNTISRSDLVNFRNTHYKPQRMVLAASGGVNHDNLVKMAEQYFSGSTAAPSFDIPTIEPCRFTGMSVIERNDDMPLAHVMVAMESVGWNNPDNIALHVASIIMGNWNRSYVGGTNLNGLAAFCAAENICHSYESFMSTYSDTGLWGAYFITDRFNIRDTLHAVQQEWMRLCTQVTDVEVERAKNKLKTSYLLQLDGTTPVFEDIGRQMLNYGRRIPLAEFEQRVNAVDANLVKEVCNRYIYDKGPAVAAVGPTEDLPDYNNILAGNYWLRV
ncbi:hypothetical protein LOTGIDRAFT_105568 [Lottia gigantea]|uniref:Mitochondrial-processing peptidase subunit beta n=1 Tax=Lottia gigantea TaxID=225164 RepID=V4AD99_LOTGI|nr:hypothetical protein LOTGIDRAFT_105568 [Lottia gigantea]ESO91311.1 hypothetical protein LOTGIDRAFT_105568 [Lottia gigantea]